MELPSDTCNKDRCWLWCTDTVKLIAPKEACWQTFIAQNRDLKTSFEAEVRSVLRWNAEMSGDSLCAGNINPRGWTDCWVLVYSSPHGAPQWHKDRFVFNCLYQCFFLLHGPTLVSFLLGVVLWFHEQCVVASEGIRFRSRFRTWRELKICEWQVFSFGVIPYVALVYYICAAVTSSGPQWRQSYLISEAAI